MSSRRQPFGRDGLICALLLSGILGCADRFDQAERLCDDADTDLQANAFQDAAQKYSAVISLHPNLARAYLGRGTALHGMGEFGSAIADYNEYLRRAAATPEVLFSRGTAYQSVGELQRAASDYMSVSRIRPDFAPAFFSMGTVAQSRGAIDEALEWYEKAIALNPNYERAIFSRDSITQAMQRNQESKRTKPAAIAGTPKSVNALYRRGLVFQRKGELTAAIEDFTRVIEIEPLRLSARYRRALAYREQKQQQEAIRDLEVVLRYDRRHAEALLLRGQLRVDTYLQMSDSQESPSDKADLLDLAIADFSQFIKLRPDEKIGYESRAQAYELAENNELAEVDRSTSRLLESAVD